MSISSDTTAPGNPSLPRNSPSIIARESPLGSGELLERSLDARQAVVRIDGRSRVTRKVLAAGEDTLRAKTLQERLGVARDLPGASSPGAPAQRVLGLVVEGNIEDGAQVEIETEQPQQLPRRPAVTLDEFGIAHVAQLNRVRRLLAEFLEPGDPASLLVDRDDRLDRTQVPEAVDQVAQLPRFLYIAGEQDKAAGIDVLDDAPGLGVERRARHAEDQGVGGF
jgi:hypothetical protein